MSRNQGLSLVIGRLVSRIHQILGDRAFEDRGHSSSSCHMLGNPNEWASEPPSQSPLRGKTAPQCLRGTRRNPEPSFIGLQVDRTQDWKMCMIQHYLLCIFVYLSPPSEYTSLGVGKRLRSLACCSPWCCKESDTTEQLNWTELKCDKNTLLSKVKLQLIKIWVLFYLSELLQAVLNFSKLL